MVTQPCLAAGCSDSFIVLRKNENLSVVVCRGRIKQLYMPNYVNDELCAREILERDTGSYLFEHLFKHAHHNQSIPFPP